MYLDKEKFLKTELGQNLEELVTAWDKALDTTSCHGGFEIFTDEYRRARKTANWCQAQWEVYQIMFRQLFKADYHFSRTDELCCIVNNDHTDFLFKVERKGENE